MSNQAQTATASFPILGILGIVFITLKLTNVINWSWWWVLAPFWGPFAFIVAVTIIIALGVIVYQMVKAIIRGLR